MGQAVDSPSSPAAADAGILQQQRGNCRDSHTNSNTDSLRTRRRRKVDGTAACSHPLSSSNSSSHTSSSSTNNNSTSPDSSSRRCDWADLVCCLCQDNSSNSSTVGSHISAKRSFSPASRGGCCSPISRAGCCSSRRATSAVSPPSAEAYNTHVTAAWGTAAAAAQQTEAVSAAVAPAAVIPAPPSAAATRFSAAVHAAAGVGAAACRAVHSAATLAGVAVAVVLPRDGARIARAALPALSADDPPSSSSAAAMTAPLACAGFAASAAGAAPATAALSAATPAAAATISQQIRQQQHTTPQRPDLRREDKALQAASCCMKLSHPHHLSSYLSASSSSVAEKVRFCFPVDRNNRFKREGGVPSLSVRVVVALAALCCCFFFPPITSSTSSSPSSSACSTWLLPFTRSCCSQTSTTTTTPQQPQQRVGQQHPQQLQQQQEKECSDPHSGAKRSFEPRRRLCPALLLAAAAPAAAAAVHAATGAGAAEKAWEGYFQYEDEDGDEEEFVYYDSAGMPSPAYPSPQQDGAKAARGGGEAAPSSPAAAAGPPPSFEAGEAAARGSGSFPAGDAGRQAGRAAAATKGEGVKGKARGEESSAAARRDPTATSFFPLGASPTTSSSSAASRLATSSTSSASWDRSWSAAVWKQLRGRPGKDRGFLLEAVFFLLLCAVGVAAYFGRKHNVKVADAWIGSTLGLLRENFCVVGYDTSYLMMRSYDTFELYCTGRRNCYYMHAVLECLPRQCLWRGSFLGALLRSSTQLSDSVVLEFLLPPSHDPITVALCRKQEQKQVLSKYWDVREFTKRRSVQSNPRLQQLPAQMVAFSDVAESLDALLLSQKAVLQTLSAASCWRLLRFIYFSDACTALHPSVVASVAADAGAHVPASAPTRCVLRIAFFLPPPGRMDDALPLLRMALYLVDHAKHLNLSEKSVETVKKLRLQSQKEQQKEQEEQRQEQLEKKRAERRRQGEEKFEKMTPEQQRKVEEKGYKKQLRQSKTRFKVLRVN